MGIEVRSRFTLQNVDPMLETLQNAENQRNSIFIWLSLELITLFLCFPKKRYANLVETALTIRSHTRWGVKGGLTLPPVTHKGIFFVFQTCGANLVENCVASQNFDNYWF